MIDWLQAIVLAFVQGVTEFLPISSSAHLVIPPLLLGWPDQGLAFDVAVHVGTLGAVLLYYRTDLLLMARDWLASLAGGAHTDDSRMVWYLLVATIPAGLVGLLAGSLIEDHLRTLPVIATTTLVFGLLLGVADRYGRAGHDAVRMTLLIALGVGLAQAFAPIPGVSRSGVTITAGLLLGLGHQRAARFSFLLSIPIIASAGGLMLLEVIQSGVPLDWLMLGTAMLVSGITAYCCIAAFLQLLERVGLMPFVYYRILLALVLYGLWLL